MISEEKVKIMAEMARYEKNHGKDDFRVYKYEKKDYIRLEQIAVYLIYSHFIKKRAARHYDEVRARVLIYDKHLEELEMLYKVEENEDVSPTIAPEEDEDGKIIDI